jgi:hypothetical protein
LDIYIYIYIVPVKPEAYQPIDSYAHKLL